MKQKDTPSVTPDDARHAVVREILAERYRQILEEGRTLENDDAHTQGELVQAAASYVLAASPLQPLREQATRVWPWTLATFKPYSSRRDLIRAAALIVAELERRDREDAHVSI